MTRATTPSARAYREAAKRYEQEGYEVIVNPPADQLPSWLADFGVDLLAVSDTLRVVVQLKARDNLRNNKRVVDLASAVAEHHGWRYDLVSVQARPHLTPRTTAPWKTERIRSFLKDAQQLTERGHREAGFVLTWVAFEALCRLIAEANDVQTGGTSPAGLVKQLVVEGLLPRSDYSFVDRAFVVRSALVHGMDSPEPFGHLLDRLMKLSERLLTQRETEIRDSPEGIEARRQSGTAKRSRAKRPN